MSKHTCEKNRCVCLETTILTNLYCDLKNFRKKAERKVIKEEKCGAEIRLTESDCDESQCNHILTILKKQRESVRKLMIAIKELNVKLANQEDVTCKADREIAELQNEIFMMKKEYDSEEAEKEISECDRLDEKAWKTAVELETQEKCRLKEKVKEMKARLEIQKQKEREEDETRREERKIDTMLLLDAVNYVVKCVQCTKAEIGITEKCK